MVTGSVSGDGGGLNLCSVVAIESGYVSVVVMGIVSWSVVGDLSTLLAHTRLGQCVLSVVGREMAAGGVDSPGESDLMLSLSLREGGSTYPKVIIDELHERMLILPQQPHLAEDIVHPAPENLFQSFIIPAHLVVMLQEFLHVLLQ